MKMVDYPPRLPFSFGGVTIPFESEQQRAYVSPEKRRHSPISRHFHERDTANITTKDRIETSDVTAINIIMPLPKYKSDLDKINCYLYQTTTKRAFKVPKEVPKDIKASHEMSNKIKLLQIRKPRYGTRPELWQQVKNASWDRFQTREPFQDPVAILSDSKKNVLKDPVTRSTINPGEWIEPDQELIDGIMNDTLDEIMKLPYPGYTGKRLHCVGNCRQVREKSERENFYLTTTKSTYRKFPAYEYRQSIHVRQSPFSKTVDQINCLSPFGNANPPERTGTWINYLYQPRWQ